MNVFKKLIGLASKTPPKRAPGRPRPVALMLALEERMMFDGAALDAGLDVVVEASGGDPQDDGGSVVAANVAPPEVVTGIGTVIITEQEPAVLLAPSLTITDADSTTLQGARIVAVNDSPYSTRDLTLLFVDQNGISGAWDAETDTLSLSGTASIADYQDALRSVAVSYDHDLPSQPYTALITVTDGSLESTVKEIEIRVTSVPDKPYLLSSELTIPGAAAGASRTVYSVEFLRIADPDSYERKGFVITHLTGSGTWSYGNDANGYIDVNREISEQVALSLESSTAIRYTASGEETEIVSFSYRGGTSEAAGKGFWNYYRNISAAYIDVTQDTTANLTNETGIVILESLAPNIAAPEVVIDSPTMFIEEKSDYVPLLSDITLSDIDSPLIHNATVTFEYSGGSYSFSAMAPPVPVSSYRPGSFEGSSLLDSRTHIWSAHGYQRTGPYGGSIQFYGDASAAEYQERLRAIVGQTHSDVPPVSITATITINDGLYDNATAQKIIVVNNRNDAPVITQVFTPAPPDGSDPAQVWPGLIGNLFTATDEDPGAAASGIAITQASGAGTWSWSSDGITYTDIVNPSVNQSLLLGPAELLRYTPAVDYAETATLSYRAWDQSQGAVGGTLSSAAFGNETPFSLRTGAISLSAQPAPLFGESGQIIHDDMVGRIGLGGDASLGDMDGDGDLDAVITGTTDSGAFFELWLNDGNANFSFSLDFEAVDPGLGAWVVSRNSSSLADLDNDGDLDLIFENLDNDNSQRSIRIYRNDGNLQFSLSQSFQNTGIANLWSTAADFNGDGFVDLLLQDTNLWLNDGNGQLAYAGSGSTRGMVCDYQIADLDDDGDLDYVATTMFPGESRFNILYYLNDGNGIMAYSASQEGFWNLSSSVVDLDGDQNLDLLGGQTNYGYPAIVQAALNDGTGNLQEVTVTHEYADAYYADDLGSTTSRVFGDLDGDGDQDYISIHSYGFDGNKQAVHLNNGSGDFIALPANQPFLNSFRSTDEMVLGDLDGDGDLDAFVTYFDFSGDQASPLPSAFTVWINDGGTLTFAPRTTATSITIQEDAATPLGNVTLSDPDSDTLEQAVITISDHDGGLTLSFTEQNGITGVWDDAAGTLTMTGNASVANYQAAVNDVSILYGLDTSHASYHLEISVRDDQSIDSVPGRFQVSVTGTNDAPVLNAGDIGLPVFYNTPSGFEVSTLLGEVTDPDLPTIEPGIAVTGLTGNGWERLSGLTWTPITTSPSESAALLLGPTGKLRYVATATAAVPAITFRAWDRTSNLTDTTVNGGQTPFSAVQVTASAPAIFVIDSGQLLGETPFLGAQDVALADFDGDGDVDALVSAFGADAGSGAPGRMELWTNVGMGKYFLSDTWIPSAGGANAAAAYGGNYRIAVGDIDNDGDQDVALGNTQGLQPLVYRNDGTGRFTLSQALNPDTFTPQSTVVEMADFNGDGALDLLYTFNDQATTSIPGTIAATTQRTIGRLWINDGTGQFTPSNSPILINDPLPATPSTVVCDLDGDGDLDLVFGTHPNDPAGEAVANQIWLNDGQGRFTRDTGQTLGLNHTNAVQTGDVDGDGDQDLFLLNAGNDASRLWLNDGLGHFSESSQRFGLAGDHRDAALVDVDGDGDLDLYVTSLGGVDQLFLNTGAGTFRVSVPLLTTATQAPNHQVEMADLDGDGDMDFFLAASPDADIPGSGYNHVLIVQPGAQTQYAYDPSNTAPTMGSKDRSYMPATDPSRSRTMRIGDFLTVDDYVDYPSGMPEEGLAIVGLTGSGTWSYSTDGGATFTDIDQWCFENSALLLSETNDLRYTPDGITQNETARIHYRGWDMSAGTVGARWDASYGGGASPFTTNVEQLFIVVEPVVEVGSGGPGTPMSTPLLHWSGQDLSAFQAESVLLDDVDGDGDLDALLRQVVPQDGPDSAHVRLMLNDGSGRFSDGGIIIELVDEISYKMELVDLDNDGDKDLFSNGFYFNDGYGFFTHRSGTGILIDQYPYQVDFDLADLNGDGSIDIFKTSSASYWTYSVHLNNRSYQIYDGLYERSSPYPATTLGDIDGDGDLDAISANWYWTSGAEPETNVIRLNDGTGKFTLSEENLGIFHSNTALLADIDGDGDLDAYLAEADLHLSGSSGFNSTMPSHVFFNDGLGHFTRSSEDLFFSNESSYFQSGLHGDDNAVFADFDGDGDQDLFHSANNHHYLLLNDGRGRFTDAIQEMNSAPAMDSFNASPWYSSYGKDISDIAVGDLDNDGDLDLFLAGRGVTSQVWINDPNFVGNPENPAPPPSNPPPPSGPPPGISPITAGETLFADSGQSLAAKSNTGQEGILQDLDGDGDLDMVVASTQHSAPVQAVFEIWRNDGVGQYELLNTYHPQAAPAEEMTLEIAVADVDGDGDQDIAVAGLGCQPQIFLNNGAAFFTLKQTLVAPYYTFAIQEMSLTDFNGDGHADLLLVNTEQQQGNYIYFNNGAGDFSLDNSKSRPGSGFFNHTSAAVGDLDGDGAPDIVFTDDQSYSSTAWCLINWNDGSGSFSPSGHQVLDFPMDNSRATLGDVDGDGDLDILLADGKDNLSALWINNGARSFSKSAQNFSTFHAIRDAVFGDYDHDGDLDLLIADDAKTTILFNNGSGRFYDLNAQIQFPDDPGLGIHIADIATGDVDGDGNLDLLVVNSNPLQDNLSHYNFILINQRAPLTEPSANHGHQATIIIPMAQPAHPEPTVAHAPLDAPPPIAHTHDAPLPSPSMIPVGTHAMPRPFTMDHSYLDALFEEGDADNAFTLTQGPLSFQLPDWSKELSFASQITLEITLEDGSPMPAWLTFDPQTGTFSGTPEGDFEGTLSLLVIRRDAFGNEVQELLNIQAEGETEEEVPQVRVLPAKPSFTAQLRQAAMAAGAR